MTHLPIVLNSGVIPMDNPDVPNAEHTSKMILVIGNGSVIDKISTDVEQRMNAIIVTARDFNISSS
jgi:DNA topoisomerase VI subunit A